MRTKPNVQYRYFFAPSKALTSGLDALSFESNVIASMIQIGKDDAKTIIDLGEGVAFRKLEAWNTK